MAAEAVHEDSPEQQPRHKRKRIALACGSCRFRKSRCDGRRPVCSLCSENHLECVWQRSAFGPSPPATTEYVASLERRLERLEQRMDFAVTSFPASNQANHVIESLQGPRSLTLTPGIGLSQNRAYARSQNEAAELEDSIDGMGIVFTEETESGYFGPSSNIAFIHSIVKGLIRSRNTSSQDASPNVAESSAKPQRSIQFSRPASPLRSVVAGGIGNIEITLPPDEEVQFILQDYFSNTGLLFPFIDREAFISTYSNLRKDNFVNVRKSWLGLLNIILALATSASRDAARSATSRTEQAELFYNRSLKLCDLHVLRTTSLEVVQYLLICAQYLQGTQRSVQTWTVHGMAVKAAMQLGIHSPDTSRGLEAIDREMRNRTWHACALLDRTLSMTFGRPGSIPDYYLRLPFPKPIHDGRDPLEAQSVQFFSSTITLYKLLWNILDTQYNQNISSNRNETSFETVSLTFKLDSQLLRWKQEVHPPLSIMLDFDTSDTSPQIQRFSVILSLRWLNIRILLHRQVLVKYLENVASRSAPSAMGSFVEQAERDSLRIAIESSKSLILVVHGALIASVDGGNVLGAWWFTIYYVFNAGLILIGVLIVQQSHETSHQSFTFESNSELEVALDMALEVLGRLDRENTLANRCMSYINKLKSIISTPDIGAFPNNQVEPITGAYEQGTSYTAGSASQNFGFGDVLIGNDLDFLNSCFGHYDNL